LGLFLVQLQRIENVLTQLKEEDLFDYAKELKDWLAERGVPGYKKGFFRR